MDLTAKFSGASEAIVAMRSDAKLCARWFQLCCMVLVLCVLRRQGKVCGLCQGCADHGPVGCRRAVIGTSLSRLNICTKHGQILTQVFAWPPNVKARFEKLLSAWNLLQLCEPHVAVAHDHWQVTFGPQGPLHTLLQLC